MKTAAIVFLLLISIQLAHAAKEYILPNGVKVLLYEKPFKAEEHNIKYCDKYPEAPCKIDGKFPFGTDLSIPKTKIIKIEVVVDSNIYELNTSGMYNAHWYRPLNIEKGYQFSVQCEDNQNCIIKGFFSDGAGTYVAGWEIVEGEVNRNIISAGEAVVYPFMESAN